MRNLDRIDEVCAELARVWKEVPDWRFCQLMSNLFNVSGNPQFFYEEDEDLLNKLKTL